jgi:hypothetical protein
LLLATGSWRLASDNPFLASSEEPEASSKINYTIALKDDTAFKKTTCDGDHPHLQSGLGHSGSY